MDRRALYQGVRTMMGEAVTTLRERGARQDGSGTDRLSEAVIAGGPALDIRLRLLLGRQIDGLRIPRYGGPLTASRVLRETGRHVVGVPDRDYRPAVDRTRLQSPLLDVASILASLRAIALRPLFDGDARSSGRRPGDPRRTEAWARTWWATVATSFVAAYLASLPRSALLPSTLEDRALLLDVLLAQLSLAEIVGLTRVGLPPDPSALVALIDLAGVSGLTTRA